MVKTVEEVEKAVTQLQKFRVWYEKFDSDAWDVQIEQDILTGKLDALADAAIADHKAGKSRKM